jgi:hypothetical protein
MGFVRSEDYLAHRQINFCFVGLAAADLFFIFFVDTYKLTDGLREFSDVCVWVLRCSSGVGIIEIERG